MLDCVIVGAGLAGLSAATDLVARGRSVVVLEARDRVGGRVETLQLQDGTQVDMGGQWIADSHAHMLALAERLGLPTAGVASGDIILRLAGTVTQVPSDTEIQASLNPFEVSDLGQGLARFRRLSQRVLRDEAWAGSNAAWLAQPLTRWVHSNLRTPGAQAWFMKVFEDAFGSQPDGLSLSDLKLRDGLAHANAGVDLESLIAVNGGVNQRRVIGGMARITEALAADLGDRVRLDSPAATITATDHRVVVTLRDGSTVEASQCIVALPPVLATALDYQPPLDQWRQETASRVAPGRIIKAVASYPDRWWAEAGHSGQMGADDGPVRVLFDVSDEANDRGVLTGFFGGAFADRTPGLREVAFSQAVADAFGEGPAHLEYVERDWRAEEFTGGCHGAHFAPGVWTAFGPSLAAPHGRVHFAGSEYAARFNGYLEGAVRSAEEAAAEVARQLD